MMHWTRVYRKDLPLSWEIISPSLSSTPVTTNKSTKQDSKGSVFKIFNCAPEQSSRIFVRIQKYLVPNMETFTMPGIQSKITTHAKSKKT